MVAIEYATRQANRAHDCPTKWHLCLPSCVSVEFATILRGWLQQFVGCSCIQQEEEQ